MTEDATVPFRMRYSLLRTTYLLCTSSISLCLIGFLQCYLDASLDGVTEKAPYPQAIPIVPIILPIVECTAAWQRII